MQCSGMVLMQGRHSGYIAESLDQSRQACGPGSQAGFSLIELLVALGIFALVAAVTIPNIAQMRSTYQLRSAVQGVFMDLQKARAAAVKERNRYHVSLVDGTSYQIHDDDNNNDTEDDGVDSVLVKDLYGNGAGVTLAMSPAQVTFLPTGRVLDLNATTFTVSNGTDSWELEISAVGRIQID